MYKCITILNPRHSITISKTSNYAQVEQEIQMICNKTQLFIIG